MSITTKRRNLWPASIIGFFIIAIIFIATYIVWAVHQREDLVSEDYYDREVRFQTHLDTMNRSQSLAVQSVVTFNPADQAILITLPASQTQGATGSVQLYRPSDARLDREFPLGLDASGIQRLNTKELLGGLWKVRVKWSAQGQEYFLDQPVIVTSL